MFQVILFLAKAFIIGGTLFFLVVGLINAVLVTSSTLLVRKVRSLHFPISVIVYLFYSYLYCSFGAFYSSLVEVYGGKGLTKWAFVFICFIALYQWIKEARKQADQTTLELRNAVNVDEELTMMKYFGEFNEKIYQASMTISGIKTAPIAMLSFFVFLVKNQWVDDVFGGWPHWLAALFV